MTGLDVNVWRVMEDRVVRRKRRYRGITLGVALTVAGTVGAMALLARTGPVDAIFCAIEVVCVVLIAGGLSIVSRARRLATDRAELVRWGPWLVPRTITWEPSGREDVRVSVSGRWRMRAMYIRSVLNEMGDAVSPGRGVR